MRKIKILGLALVAVFALASAVAATSAMAFELPDIHTLAGEETVVGEGATSKVAKAATLETEIGEVLNSEELKASVTVEKLAALGKANFNFQNVTKGTTKCNTEGDAEGVVLVPGEYHLVILTKTPSLTAGFLILFSTVTIKCAKLSIKVTQPVLTTLAGVTSGTATTEFKTQPVCSGKGKQLLTSYFNDEEKELTKQLILANFGLGNEFGCESTKEAVTIKGNHMVTFLF